MFRARFKVARTVTLMLARTEQDYSPNPRIPLYGPFACPRHHRRHGQRHWTVQYFRRGVSFRSGPNVPLEAPLRSIAATTSVRVKIRSEFVSDRDARSIGFA